MHLATFPSSVLSTATLLLAAVAPLLVSAGCASRDHANPIADRFPGKVTGVLNGTTMIIPIPLEEARQIVPDQWDILEGAYRELLPDFPDGMYPMVATGVHDHDIRYKGPLGLGLSIPDFSRAAFEFPFIDMLQDGSSSLRYAPTMLITALTPAIAGVKLYGISPHSARFSPACDAYDLLPNGTSTFSARSSLSIPGVTTTRTFSVEAAPAVRGEEEEEEENPYPMAFVRNVTNQVTSANGVTCDAYERIYDTELTTGEGNAPVSVRGRVAARLEPFEKEEGGRTWEGVWGWRFATGFTEPAMPDKCSSLK